MDETSEGGRSHTTTDYRFAPIPEDVLYDTRLSFAARVIYGALMRHGLAAGSCFPSLQRIGKLVGMTAGSVRRPLRELTDAGWVTRVPRYSDQHPAQRMNDGFHVHTTTTGVLNSTDPPVSDSTDPPVLDNTQTPVLESTTEREPFEREPFERKHVAREPSTLPLDTGPTSLAVHDETAQPSDIDVLDPFGSFWDDYPRKVGKRTAQAAYGRAVRRSSADAICAGLRAHLPAWSQTDPQFIPHPTTWLNRDGWNDDPPSVPKRPQSADERNRANRDALMRKLLDQQGATDEDHRNHDRAHLPIASLPAAPTD